FSDGMTALELSAWSSPHGPLVLLLFAALVVSVLEWAVRRSGRAWTIDQIDPPEESVSSVTVLDLVTATPKSARAMWNHFPASGRLPSSGAPVPDEPRNSVWPFGSVRSRPFARSDPSFDWYPSTVICVPVFSESFVKPRRRSVFGVPASIIHSSTVP